MGNGAHSGSALDVSLFGGPVLSGPEGRLGLSPMQIALVALVCGHGPDGITRRRVARLLWADRDRPAVRQRIRQLLHGIRRRAGVPVFDRSEDLLRSDPHTLRSDLDAFERCLETWDLTTAARLVTLGFVPQLNEKLSDEFETWRSSRERALHRKVLSRANVRWAEAHRRGSWTDAREAAEALYTLSPSDSEAVTRLLEALTYSGDVAEAERVHAEYRAGLDPGEEPPAHIEDLVDRARATSERLRSAPWTRRHEVPFVGRSDALRLAGEIFDRVDRGSFDFVLITGESGIGKTRLLEELERGALLRGVRCLRAQSVELEQRIPLNPLVDALSDLDLEPHLAALGQPWSTVVGSTLPSGALAEPPGELPPIRESSLSRRLLDAFFLLLERIASERPTVFLLDDLHWADATTIAALQFVQRRWREGGLGIVATLRPEMLTRSDPAWTYLTGSDRLSVRRVQLSELTTEEAHELVARISDSGIDDVRASRLCELAGFNPLYLTELTRDHLAGRVRLPEVAADEVLIPVSLAQILDDRLRHLSRRTRKVAGLLAVASRPMRLADLAELTSMSTEECAGCAEELERWRLVDMDRDTVRVSHELFRSALYRQLSEARRAIFHRGIADRIAARDPQEASGQLAFHYSRAGESDMAAHFGWRAAKEALGKGAVAEAAHFFQLVTENESDAALKADATAELAKALHLNREIRRANPLLELAAKRLRSSGDQVGALRMEIRRVEGLAEEGATPVSELIDRLLLIQDDAKSRGDWESVALALDTELQLRHRIGDLDGITAVFSRMRTIAEVQDAAPAAICFAGLALGVLFGDADEALSAGRKAASLTTREGDHRLRALMRLLVVLQYRGMLELPNSQTIVKEARTLAQRSGDLLARFSLESNLAVASLDAGDLDRASVLMSRSTAMLGSADMDLNRFNQAYNTGELALAQDDFGLARASFEDASSYLGPNTPDYARELITAGLGLCALQIGQLSEARRRNDDLGPTPARWFYDPTTVVTFRAKLLERQGRVGQAMQILAETAADVEGRLVLAWLKVVAVQLRLGIRHGASGLHEIGLQAHSCAKGLRLGHRARELESLLERL